MKDLNHQLMKLGRQNRDGGFSRTLDGIVGSAPAGVSLEEVDDDGRVVRVRATASTYDLLLDFTRVLEGADGIFDVRVNSIGSTRSSPASAEEELYGLFPGLLLGDEGDGEFAVPTPGTPLEPLVGRSAGTPMLELELTR